MGLLITGRRFRVTGLGLLGDTERRFGVTGREFKVTRRGFGVTET